MIYTYILAAISITATVANVKRKRWCFVGWLVTNIAWCAHNLYIGQYALAAQFAVYAALAAWGLKEWGKER